jgi:hypothetical protein
MPRFRVSNSENPGMIGPLEGDRKTKTARPSMPMPMHYGRNPAIELNSRIHPVLIFIRV